MRPVPVHAGGIVWYGPAILVADTRGGIRTFEVDDILQGRRRRRLARLPTTCCRSARRTGRPTTAGFSPFKFSFVSLDRSGPEHQLIAGEYGATGHQEPADRGSRSMPPRPRSAMEGGVARPLEILLDGLTHMQGATVVGGTYYISTSRGSKTPGTLWVRRAGRGSPRASRRARHRTRGPDLLAPDATSCGTARSTSATATSTPSTALAVR